jgi:MerR family redox-sensitive transcriptional activator SoxR
LKELTIGEVARRTGYNPSALRYYESVGLIRPVERVNKQRRYHPEVLNRLAIIETARQAGFSIPAIAQLLAGFGGNQTPGLAPDGGPSDGPWASLARQQIAELDRQIGKMRRMQELLSQLVACACPDLDHCGQALSERRLSGCTLS